MRSFLRRIYRHEETSLSLLTRAIEDCFSSGSFNFVQIIQAQLIKVVDLDRETFLGNRCVELYFKFGAVNDALKVFDDIRRKNIMSWNVCLNGLLKFGHFRSAYQVFDEMPERDVVSWNSMISGYLCSGRIYEAFWIFSDMQKQCVRPSGFTFSILTSFVSFVTHGKQIHGSMIRNGVDLNLVIGNSLIDMYGRVGLFDYAFNLFLNMEEVDVISWNSLISCCCKSDQEELALKLFCLMRSSDYVPDEFTVSSVITVCTKLGDLEKGKQILAFSLKVAFLSNSIVMSATIDLFSKCNRMEDSVRLFEEATQLDSALCDSMISSYVRHGLWEDSLQIFIHTFRDGLKPTEFTLNNVLNSTSFLSTEIGSQVHSLVVKLGFESEIIVANSLVDMYAKTGYIAYAMKMFCGMHESDLISWNTLIIGLARNGRYVEALHTFKELAGKGPPPDGITFAGILSACRYGGFLDEGMRIFSSMEKEHGVTPSDEHYCCIVDLLCQAGKLKEAIDFTNTMPFPPSAFTWEPILLATVTINDLNLVEMVSERMMESEPQSSLPYLVLIRVCEMRGRWEGVTRLRNAMKERRVKNITGCSWIGIRNKILTFKADRLQYQGSQDIYSMMQLLSWEVEDKEHIYLQHD